MTHFAHAYFGGTLLTTAYNPKQHHGNASASLLLVRSKRQAGFGLFGALVMMLITLLIGSSRASAEAWVPIAPPPAISSGSTATALADGRILLAGVDAAGSAFVYDPGADRWITADKMKLARSGHAAALLPSGKVLVTGGTLDAGLAPEQSEIFDPATLTWSQTKNMIDARRGHSLTTLHDGRVLATGGLTYNAYYARRAELFDEKSMTWTPAGASIAPGPTATTLLANGEVLVTGGEYGSALSVSQIFLISYLPQATAFLSFPRRREPRPRISQNQSLCGLARFGLDSRRRGNDSYLRQVTNQANL